MAESATIPTVSLRPLLSHEGRRNPFPYYAELHKHGPVCRITADGYRFDVMVHGFDAVSKVMRDPTFRVMDTDYPDRRGETWREHAALRTLLASVFFTDGPEHIDTRRLFSQVFTPRRIAGLQPAMIRIINARLDRLAALGSGGDPVDFVGEFALPVPADVIGELLGVPEQDRPWFPDRVRAFGAILDLGSGTWRFQQAADTAAVELSAYFTELVAKRRAEPREDLISALVQAQADGAPLTDDELIANLLTLFNAGFVTTTHLIGNGLSLMLEHPELLHRLLAEPSLAPAYIEEILRFELPTHFTIRWATADTELAGVPIPEGSRVLVMFGAANRDPSRFTDPDVFDPSRQDNQHVAFGSGLHFCLGAALSRLEGQLALPMVFQRFPEIRIAGEPGLRDKLMLRGYESLPVAVS